MNLNEIKNIYYKYFMLKKKFNKFIKYFIILKIKTK